jgi:hypothetical protein
VLKRSCAIHTVTAYTTIKSLLSEATRILTYVNDVRYKIKGEKNRTLIIIKTSKEESKI